MRSLFLSTVPIKHAYDTLTVMYIACLLYIYNSVHYLLLKVTVSPVFYHLYTEQDVG
jgi:hypothetical protein